MIRSHSLWTLCLIYFFRLRPNHAELYYSLIFPVTDEAPSRRLHKRNKPDFGGRLGIANASELSKHKNRIKTIGVQFFAEDSLAIFKQNQSWQETYDYDSSVGYHWFGKSNTGLGTMNMVVKEYQDLDNQTTTVIAGSVSNENYVYNFHTDEDGFIEVTAVNVSNFPREAEPIGDHHHRRSLVSDNFSPMEKQDRSTFHFTPSNRSLAEDGSLVDVICFYTRKALCNEANQALTCNLDQYRYLMDNKCALAISETNVAFQNSGVLTKLRLVYSGYIDATQTNDFCSNLDRMMYNTNSAWVNARNLRNLYKADLMHMIIDNSNSCGCAYIDGWVSVSHRGCTTGYFSFGHEVGHNFGCLHDPITEAGKPCSQLQGSNYGYQDPSSRFRSIMAYNCKKNCTRIQHFSNPYINVSDPYGAFKNAPIGSYCSNNVGQINNARYVVANFLTGSSSPTFQPTTNPSTRRPVSIPSISPTLLLKPNSVSSTLPTLVKTNKPSMKASSVRSSRPTKKPSVKPSAMPSSQPITKRPTAKPSQRKPTRKPSIRPSAIRSRNPSRKPIANPSLKPSLKPLSKRPTSKPSQKQRSRKPSRKPSIRSRRPSLIPSTTPTIPSNLQALCSVASSSCLASQVTMTLRLDRPKVLSWSVIDLSTNQTACSGGPYNSSSTLSLSYCLRTSQKLKLQLRDMGTVGFLKSNSTYNVTIGLINTKTYYYFTKNNGQTLAYWRGHNFAI